MDIAIPIALALALGVGFALILRWRLRGTNRSEWRRRWKSVERKRRREIARAVRRGEAVSDPREAQLAIDFANRMAELEKALPLQGRPAPILELAGVALALLAALAIGHPALAALALWPAVLAAAIEI